MLLVRVLSYCFCFFKPTIELIYSTNSERMPLKAPYIYCSCSRCDGNVSYVYYSLPHTGMLLLSSLVTMEHMVMVTGMASKYEECGATVRMGASEGATLSPFTLIQWKPPQNHMARMITRRLRSKNLMEDMWIINRKFQTMVSFNL